MVNVTLGDKTYTGVAAVKTDTPEGGTVEFAPYEETFAAGKAEGIEEGYANGKTDGVEEGYANGKTEGIAEGYENGKTDGVSEGIRSEYDRLWDSLQLNGNRTDYSDAFGIVWSTETFRPKYDLTAEGAYAMFANFSHGKPINLKQILVDTGVQLMFRNSRNISSLFQSSAVMHLGELDFGTVTNKGCTSLFNACTHLVSIDKLVLPIGQTTFNYWFGNCTALEHITIEGEIGADISFQWSPLSGESIRSVVSHLSDSAAGKTVTFKLSAVNSAFETAEGAADGSASEAWAALIATKSNWTISCV